MDPGPSRLQAELDAEQTQLLRRRLLWLCGLVVGVQVFAETVGLVVLLLRTAFDMTQVRSTQLERSAASLAVDMVWLAAFSAALWVVWKRCRTRGEVLRAAFGVVVGAGVISTVDVYLEAEQTQLNVHWIEAASRFAAFHLLACLLIPWTPRQAVQPLMVLYPLWLVAATLREGIEPRLLAAGLLPAIGINLLGVGIAWWRQEPLRQRLESAVLSRHYARTRRELIDARKIHEARFPPPLRDGAVRLDYFYEPMRQIGGDFLHAHRDAAGNLHVALIDVTGHGIPAALTVNRLDGEVKRIFAEDESTPPDRVVEMLNRYLVLTLARHSIFATGICLRLTPEGEFTWANAGHPPALLRRADGSVHRLDSTTFMLGVAPPEVFDAEAKSLTLNRGEAVVLYTDGAMEAKDRRGRQLGIDGLVTVVSRWRDGAGPDLARFLPEAVRRFRFGPPEDDVLVAAVRRV